MFISFEGGEGTGKSTQLKLLSQWLNDQGIEHALTREPGGCESAEEIRTLLLTGEGDRWTPMSEVLLFSAARCEHLRHVIVPALEKGQWVLCDRFADSTTVYQAAASGVDMDVVQQISDLVVGNNWPDLTFVFDIAPEVGLGRKNVQISTESLDEIRMEGKGLEFHTHVRDAYLKVARANQGRCRVINADNSVENIHNELLSYIKEYM